MSLILRVNKADLMAMSISVRAIITTGTLKEKEMKPNSAEYKVLALNRELEEKLNYTGNLLNKFESLGRVNPEGDLELNRAQAKVLIATMVHTTAIQASVMGSYEKRPDTHESFGPEPGRRKVDYVNRLKERMEETGNVIQKIKAAL